MTTRCKFLKNTAIATAGAGLAPVFPGAFTGCASSGSVVVMNFCLLRQARAGSPRYKYSRY